MKRILKGAGIAVALLSSPLRLGAISAAAQQSAQASAQEPEPIAVRHDIAQAGREFLVLRHQRLVKGSHQRFYELSRDGVWPLYEKIGARVVGQWQVVHPEGGGPDDYDEGYRLARYRSFNHWAATRRPDRLGGNGPDYHAGMEAIRARNQLRLGSNGAILLEGATAPGGPYYFPPLEESYQPGAGSASDDDAPRPVRHDVARRGEEIVTLRYFKIKKGTFEEFHRLSRDGVWPFFEKMGARIVGQWQVVYPDLGTLENRGGGAAPRIESVEYDEVYMLARYASYQHWQATRPPVMADLGGDGLDYQGCAEALRRRRGLTLKTSVQFLQGHVYHSPPVYLPALEESYRLSGDGGSQ